MIVGMKSECGGTCKKYILLTESFINEILCIAFDKGIFIIFNILIFIKIIVIEGADVI